MGWQPSRSLNVRGVTIREKRVLISPFLFLHLPSIIWPQHFVDKELSESLFLKSSALSSKWKCVVVFLDIDLHEKVLQKIFGWKSYKVYAAKMEIKQALLYHSEKEQWHFGKFTLLFVLYMHIKHITSVFSREWWGNKRTINNEFGLWHFQQVYMLLRESIECNISHCWYVDSRNF